MSLISNRPFNLGKTEFFSFIENKFRHEGGKGRIVNFKEQFKIPLGDHVHASYLKVVFCYNTSPIFRNKGFFLCQFYCLPTEAISK